MLLVRWFLPFFVTAGNILLLEYFIFTRTNIFVVLAISLVFILGALVILLHKKISEYRSKWQFYVAPLAVWASSFATLLLIEQAPFRQAVIISGSLMLGFLLRVIYNFFYNRRDYIEASLPNIAHYSNLLSVYFLTASGLGLTVYLQWSFVWLIAPYFLMTMLLTYYTYWTHRLDLHVYWSHLVITSLIMTELWVGIYLLPFHFFASAFISALAYYYLVGLSLNYFLGNPFKAVVRRYILVGLSAGALFLLAHAV